MTVARSGRWRARPEYGIDPSAAWSRSIDVLLDRREGAELAVVELEDLLADGGSTMRGLADKVAAVRRSSPPEAQVAGLLVLRATSRNRATMNELASLFETRFPGSSSAWIRALRDANAPMPLEDGVLWSSVSGDRLMVVGRSRTAGGVRRRTR